MTFGTGYLNSVDTSGAADSAVAALNVTSPFLRPRTFSALAQLVRPVSLKVGTGDFASATGHRLNAPKKYSRVAARP
jgi:hypothetical protein